MSTNVDLWNLVNDVAPKNNFFSFIYLRSDKFEDKKLKSIVNQFKDLNSETQTLVVKQLRERQVALETKLDSWFINTIFFKLFSALTKEQIVERNKALLKTLQNWNTEFNFIDAKRPLLQQVPDYFVKTDELNKPNGELFKERFFHLYMKEGTTHLVWYNNATNEKEDITCTPDEFINFLCVIKCYRSLNFRYENGNFPLKLVKSLDNCKSSDFSYETTALYLDLKGNIFYFNPKEPDSKVYIEWDKIPEESKHTHENYKKFVLSKLKHVNGTFEAKKELDEHLGNFTGASTSNNTLDIRIELANDNTRKLMAFNKYGVVLNETYEFGSYAELRKKLESRQKRILEDLHVIVNNTAPNKAQLALSSRRPVLESIDGEYLSVRVPQMTERGLVASLVKINYRKESQAVLENALKINYPPQSNVNQWKEDINKLTALARVRGLLYDPAKIYKTEEIYLKVETVDGWTLPIVTFEWKDETGNLQKVHLKNCSPEVLEDLSPIKSLIVMRKAANTFKHPDDLKNHNQDKPTLLNFQLAILTHQKSIRVDLFGMDNQVVHQHIPVDATDCIEYIHAKIKEVISQHQTKIKEQLADLKNQYKDYIENEKPTQSSPNNIKIELDESLHKNKGHKVYFWHPHFRQLYSYTTANHSAESIEKTLKMVKNVQELSKAILNHAHEHLEETALSMSPNINKQILNQTFDKIVQLKKLIVPVQNGESYKVYFKYPRKDPAIPSSYCSMEITSADKVEEIMKSVDQYREDIETFKIGDAFLKKTSQFMSVEVPPLLPEIDLKKIERYYNKMNFTDPKHPNYVSPYVGKNRIDTNEAKANIEKFYRTLAEKNDKTTENLRAILSHIVKHIKSLPKKERLIETKSVIDAMCYCETKQEDAFSSVLNIMKGIISGASIDEFPFEEVQLSRGDAMKSGAAYELASETFSPINLTEYYIYMQSGPQTTHVYKKFVQDLHAMGIPVPLGDTANTDDRYAILGRLNNYRTPVELKVGFLNIINAGHLIRSYQEHFNNDLRNKLEDVTGPITNLMLDFIGDYLLKYDLKGNYWKENVDVAKKRAELADKLEAIRKERDKTIQEYNAKSANEIAELVKGKREKLEAAAQSVFEVQVSATPWDPKVALDEDYENLLVNKPTATQEEKAKLKSAFIERKRIRDEIAKKTDADLWEILKSETKVQADQKARNLKNQALMPLLDDTNLLTYDEETFQISSVTREGTIGLLCALMFLQLRAA